ncbi:hypothetical protein NDU88_007945 [Pleurodeles waltl]|uniref:Uncharacterized protein n=1 Tax=Pleurodeles waltl TaxID=8319 RepID=A0AAV7VTR4_PLEWA|nr:hypothetical protein NDU88_007945 [Pleurodeles waltl]
MVAKDKLYSPMRQQNTSPGMRLASEAVQPQGGHDIHQYLPAIQSTAVDFPGPTPAQVVRQVGKAQAPTLTNSMGGQVSVAAQAWVPPPVIPPSVPTIPAQARLSTSPLFLSSTASILAPTTTIAWHVPAETKEKIYGDEYVDVFDLINVGVAPGKPRSEKEEELKPQMVWEECSLKNWVTGFSNYASI